MSTFVNARTAAAGALLVASCATACRESARESPVVRLAARASDTMIVNGTRPTALPVRALDAAGRPVARAMIRYAKLGGDSIVLDPPGTVRCHRAGDAVVSAEVEGLRARLVVRCRPVEHVRIPGPVQFILGDSAMSRPRVLPVEAYARDGRAVETYAARAFVRDSSVARLRGDTIEPRARGITLAGVQVGDRSAAIGVHIYQRVDGLGALERSQAVRVSCRAERRGDRVSRVRCAARGRHGRPAGSSIVSWT